MLEILAKISHSIVFNALAKGKYPLELNSPWNYVTAMGSKK